MIYLTMIAAVMPRVVLRLAIIRIGILRGLLQQTAGLVVHQNQAIFLKLQLLYDKAPISGISYHLFS